MKIFKHSWRIQWFFLSFILSTVFLVLILLIDNFFFLATDFVTNFIPLLFFGTMIIFALLINTIVKFFGSVQITNNGTVRRKVFSYTLWDIPISSISDLGNCLVTFGSYGWIFSNLEIGFLIKANNHFYKIPHDLKEPLEFVRSITTINPNVVYTPIERSYSRNKLWMEYFNKVLIKHLVGIMLFILLLCLYLIIGENDLWSGGFLNLFRINTWLN